MSSRKLGVKWVSRFVQRHKDVIHLHVVVYQEAARLKTNTLANRRGLYSLLSDRWTFKLTSADDHSLQSQSIPPFMYLRHGQNLLLDCLKNPKDRLEVSAFHQGQDFRSFQSTHRSPCLHRNYKAMLPVIVFQRANV